MYEPDAWGYKSSVGLSVLTMSDTVEHDVMRQTVSFYGLFAFDESNGCFNYRYAGI